MAIALEFLTFPASDAFIKNKGKSFQPIIDELKTREGCLKVYTGVQAEDKKTGYLLIVWGSYELHKKFIDDPNYGKIVQGLLPGYAGGLETSDMQHIVFPQDPANALSAPISEFAFFVLKEGVKKEALLESLGVLSAEADKVTAHAPSVYGESREHPNTFVLTIGWDSVEVTQTSLSRYDHH
ncbi:hypothetical protein BD779DRAFT_533802 [Infundibulicybe gibba]|nr:hypothetical protein BD779DRAFT_533802 [Infundibulicybe gibba]